MSSILAMGKCSPVLEMAPAPQNQAREASDTAHGLKEELHIFSELREIGSWSSV